MIRKGMMVAIFVMVMIIWQMFSLYFTVETNQHESIDAVLPLIEEAGYQVEEVNRFHGDRLYVMALAKKENNQEYYIAATEEKIVAEIPVNQLTLKREDATTLMQKQFPEVINVQRINPAFSEGEFTWEMVATDENNCLQYLYFQMEDGKFQKRYVLNQK